MTGGLRRYLDRRSAGRPLGPYRDRAEAGRVLAGALTAYAGRDDVLVLGLPRGGVPVAAEVARRLGAPLDALVVRKLGLPAQPGLAMGAIAAVGPGVEVVRNEDVLAGAGVAEAVLAAVLARETGELRRRLLAYRGDAAPPAVAGRTVVLVDDGLATGATMLAAVGAVRARGAARVAVAAPVGSRETCERLLRAADDVVCPWTPEPLRAVGAAYLDFAPTSDDEVRALLAGGTVP